MSLSVVTDLSQQRKAGTDDRGDYSQSLVISETRR